MLASGVVASMQDHMFYTPIPSGKHAGDPCIRRLLHGDGLVELKVCRYQVTCRQARRKASRAKA